MTTQSQRWTETPLLFRCEGEQLIGVICCPEAIAPGRAGVLIVVGGPQYRAGSHRQFTLWARAFASAGHACMRFDVRGMGDSTGVQRSFEKLSADIGAALDAFVQSCPGLSRVVLCGLCDGASAVLLYLDERRDTRIAGLILLNPWVHQLHAQSRSMVKHYYPERLFQRSLWLNAMRGRTGWRAMRELGSHLMRALGNVRTNSPGFADRMARGLGNWDGPVLLALSGEDLTAGEFFEHARVDMAWHGALARASVERLELPGADHTLSQASDRQMLENASTSWLDRLPGRDGEITIADTP